MTNPLGSVATSDGRYYERNGERFLSVTNIIDKAMSKPALVPWAVKLCAEAALADLHRCRTDAESTRAFMSEGCYPLTGYHPTELLLNSGI